MDWLDTVTDHLARECGIDPTPLRLTPDDVETLLDLAGVAAHASGARTNAPLLCHVIGAARAQGVALEDLDRAIRSFADRT